MIVSFDAVSGRDHVTRRTRTALAVGVLALAGGGAYAWHLWRSPSTDLREQLLQQTPAAADSVIYADLDALRQTRFLQELYSWAPRPAEDVDYQQFVRDTGFNYETDLRRVAIALENHDGAARFFAVADGHFDRKKIQAYALHNGKRETRGGRDFYVVSSSPGNPEVTFTFLAGERIAITNDANAEEQLSAPHERADAEWLTRFRRLSGTPVFILMKQSASAAQSIASQAPGGLRSPQLATLLGEMQWLSVGGIPRGEYLQLVAEGETTDEQVSRQLADFLNGALVLAEAGLNGAKLRAQLNGSTRRAYLDLLKTADVSRVDRGETKSVRLVLDVSPALLELARNVQSEAAEPPPARPTTEKRASTHAARSKAASKP